MTNLFLVNRMFFKASIVFFLLFPPAFSVLADNSSLKIGDRLPADQKQPTNGHAANKHDKNAYRDITWDDLIPNGWDPSKELQDINFDGMGDGDPRIEAAMNHMREIWDTAPAEKSMDGVKIRLAGFVVPLEYKGDDIHEFLLVPYFGACIHVPPPPANQIIHVYVDKLPKDFEAMYPFWVKGTLKIDHSATDMGFSTYVMQADSYEVYEEPS